MDPSACAGDGDGMSNHAAEIDRHATQAVQALAALARLLPEREAEIWGSVHRLTAVTERAHRAMQPPGRR